MRTAQDSEWSMQRKLYDGHAAPHPYNRVMLRMEHSMDERSGSCRALIGTGVAITLCLSGCAHDLSRDRLARMQVLALIQTLNADLLSHDSATLTLERWCADRHLAEPEPVRIVAHRVRGEAKPIPADLREWLQAAADEPIGYRRVRLTCGAHVLSEADNWYVPARLTAEMNRLLDTTDEPFGKVVRALGFQRRTLSADLLWSPLPADWDRAALSTDASPLRIPQALLRHTAILYTSAQQPFSAVVETYTNQVLAYGPWSPYLANAGAR
jgi:chorismate-pyruvate lyase